MKPTGGTPQRIDVGRGMVGVAGLGALCVWAGASLDFNNERENLLP